MGWIIIDHVCSECLGRLLKSEDEGRFRCSSCGRETEHLYGSEYRELCCCGITLKDGRDAGIRCMHNDAPTPEFPCEIVAAEEITLREAAG